MSDRSKGDNLAVRFPGDAPEFHDQSRASTRRGRTCENKRTLDNSPIREKGQADSKRRRANTAEGTEGGVASPQNSVTEKPAKDSDFAMDEEDSDDSKSSSGSAPISDQTPPPNRSLQWLRSAEFSGGQEMGALHEDQRVTLTDPADSRQSSFTPLIAKMPEKTRLKRGMMWRSWDTVTAIPYSVLSGLGIPAKLPAASLADILRVGTLNGEADLETRAYAMDLDCFYRDEFQEEVMEDWAGDERIDQDPLGSPGNHASGSIGEYKIDDLGVKIKVDPPVTGLNTSISTDPGAS
ncbi:hypothetical protein CBR_g39488 [Chara braunii]|uniref:Uncharacterized protein n=1 Tax=Chara braunii TaxID=69332 RepID=A0A388LRS4_CHABU|nr:hypothetical protein CBR_g39488 [Chara braunii]|eukprot:GBG85024.1 hypothetical protein CBR_g39488 [Chara braunii]